MTTPDHAESIVPGVRPAVSQDEPQILRRMLAALSLDGIVDLHTHFMPGAVMDKVWAYFDQVGPLTGRPWPIAYRAEETERVATLRALGVRHFTSLIYPHKPDMAAWLNAWAADFAAATPGCLHTATFYPEPSASAYVPAAVESGARIFKSHVQVGDYDPNDPLLDPVWRVLEESRTPVLIHSGDGPAPGRFTGPAGMQRLLARHPHLVLVIAHMGLPDYAAFLDLADRYAGVYLDTTMAFTDFTEASHPFPPVLRARLLDLGDRIVFGSDFPNIPYSYAHAVESVTRLRLGDDWSRAVLHDNATRLLDLPPLSSV